MKQKIDDHPKDSTRREKNDRRSGEKLTERKWRRLRDARGWNCFLNKGTWKNNWSIE